MYKIQHLARLCARKECMSDYSYAIVCVASSFQLLDSNDIKHITFTLFCYVRSDPDKGFFLTENAVWFQWTHSPNRHLKKKSIQMFVWF